MIDGNKRQLKKFYPLQISWCMINANKWSNFGRCPIRCFMIDIETFQEGTLHRKWKTISKNAFGWGIVGRTCAFLSQIAGSSR